MLGDLKYAKTRARHRGQHNQLLAYKKALDELVAHNDKDATYQMFEKRFVKYNQTKHK